MTSIAQLTARREEATVTIEGLEFTVAYRPNRLTMHRMIEMERLAKESDLEAMAALVPEILESWDLEGPLDDDEGETVVDEGEVIPVDPDVLVHLPVMFYAGLSRELQRLATEGPNPTKARPRSKKRSRTRS